MTMSRLLRPRWPANRAAPWTWPVTASAPPVCWAPPRQRPGRPGRLHLPHRDHRPDPQRGGGAARCTWRAGCAVHRRHDPAPRSPRTGRHRPNWPRRPGPAAGAAACWDGQPVLGQRDHPGARHRPARGNRDRTSQCRARGPRYSARPARYGDIPLPRRPGVRQSTSRHSSMTGLTLRSRPGELTLHSRPGCRTAARRIAAGATAPPQCSSAPARRTDYRRRESSNNLQKQ